MRRRFAATALALALLTACCPAPQSTLQSAPNVPETAFTATVLTATPQALTLELASGEVLRVMGEHPPVEPGARVYVRGRLHADTVTAETIDLLDD